MTLMIGNNSVVSIHYTLKNEAGMTFLAHGEDGAEQQVRVTAVSGDEVMVDANHPMAGMTLHFEVEIVDVREGTEQEIEHGHVHQPGADH